MYATAQHQCSRGTPKGLLRSRLVNLEKVLRWSVVRGVQQDGFANRRLEMLLALNMYEDNNIRSALTLGDVDSMPSKTCSLPD